MAPLTRKFLFGLPLMLMVLLLLQGCEEYNSDNIFLETDHRTGSSALTGFSHGTSENG